MTDLTSCAQDLVLAIFRLAVCDYVGVSYGHDGPDRRRRVPPIGHDEAAGFLQSPWAEFLGDVAGISAPAVWTIAKAKAGDMESHQRASLVDRSAGQQSAWSTRLAA
jgi:hypothetical protein